MKMMPFSIEVKVLAYNTYTKKMYAPTLSEAKLYVEAMISKSDYINWEENVMEISLPIVKVKSVK